MDKVAAVAYLLIVGIVFFWVGWFTRGWHDGTDISAGDAAISSQVQTDAGVETVRKVDAAMSRTTEAERVVYRTIEVPVDKECIPGAGPVSEPFELQLRQLAEERAARAKAD